MAAVLDLADVAANMAEISDVEKVEFYLEAAMKLVADLEAVVVAGAVDFAVVAERLPVLPAISVAAAAVTLALVAVGVDAIALAAVALAADAALGGVVEIVVAVFLLEAAVGSAAVTCKGDLTVYWKINFVLFSLETLCGLHVIFLGYWGVYIFPFDRQVDASEWWVGVEEYGTPYD